MSFQTIQFEIENRVAWLVMNRPEMKNALNAEMREEMFLALADVAANDEIRCLVVTGAGSGFCSGADLSGGRAAGSSNEPPHPGAGRAAMRQNSQRLIRAYWELEKPVVAAVNGVAAGFGAHLALACDLVVAAEEAKFIEVFVRRGIALDAGGAYLLMRRIGIAKAKELVFLGEARRRNLQPRDIAARDRLRHERGVGEHDASAANLRRQRRHRDRVHGDQAPRLVDDRRRG